MPKKMNSDDTLSRWLYEWETISRRIENIDARLWQGAGIVLVISLGGISLIGWDIPMQLGQIIVVLLAGLISALILLIWWFMFHRWIHLQRIYSFRAREIEEALNLWFNRYTRLIERWNLDEAAKNELSKKHPDIYERLQTFWEKEHKNRRFIHVTILKSLKWLTMILWLAWLLFVAFYWVAYFTSLL